MNFLFRYYAFFRHRYIKIKPTAAPKNEPSISPRYQFFKNQPATNPAKTHKIKLSKKRVRRSKSGCFCGFVSVSEVSFTLSSLYSLKLHTCLVNRPDGVRDRLCTKVGTRGRNVNTVGTYHVLFIGIKQSKKVVYRAVVLLHKADKLSVIFLDILHLLIW